jgi:hypothetical protein
MFPSEENRHIIRTIKEQLFLFFVLYSLERRRIMKVLEMDELPEGFFYFTNTHIVVGTGKSIEKEPENERVHPKTRKQMVLHC